MVLKCLDVRENLTYLVLPNITSLKILAYFLVDPVKKNFQSPSQPIVNHFDAYVRSSIVEVWLKSQLALKGY